MLKAYNRGKAPKIGFALKLTLCYTAVVALLIGMAAAIFYVYTWKNTERSLKESLSVIIENNAKNVGDFFARVNMFTDILNQEDSDFYNMIAKTGGNILVAVRNYDNAREYLIDSMDITFHAERYTYTASLFADPGMELSDILSSRPLPQFERAKMGNVNIYGSKWAETKEWYQKAVNLSGDVHWFSFPGNNDAIYMARLLENWTYSNSRLWDKRLGVVVIGMDVSWIQKRIDTARLTENTVVMLCDGNDQVIYTGDNNLLNRNLRDIFDTSDLTKISDRMQFMYLNGRQCAVQAVAVSRNLNLITIIPSDDISRQVYGLISVVAGVSALMILAGLIAVTGISRVVVKPILRLSGHMRANSLLEPISCDNISEDEVRVLYDSFNNLMDRINNLISEVRESALKQKIAEIKTLQAQINPHFLYNTLDAVCSVALLNGDDNIADVLNALASLMRYNITAPDSLVTLGDEIEMIGNYLEIQKLRYGERLNVNYEYKPNVLRLYIPKMIIQPLMENCIYYGASVETGHIDITVRIGVQNGVLHIRVTDKGACEDAEKINAHLRGEINIAKSQSGFGIRNVLQRIQMNFGADYGLRYEKSANGGTSAIAVLPAINTPVANTSL